MPELISFNNMVTVQNPVLHSYEAPSKQVLRMFYYIVFITT